MREIELKAHAYRWQDVKARLESRLGEGGEVHKLDRYLRRPGEDVQAMRLRMNNGSLEFAVKRTHSGPEGEDNEEYEFSADRREYERALEFFHVLGLEDFFIKKKDGWQWMDGDAHIELLSVNTLGWFLEIEVLLPFGSSEEEEAMARNAISSIMDECGIEESDYESRAYRDMILEAEGGIQSKPYTR